MSGMTAVSVVIATKDRPKDAVACIDALARQTMVDAIEVCVINDGGQPLAQILEPYARQLAMKCVDLPVSVGQVAARNEGLKVARGEYIAFCDDDDRHLPSHLEHLSTTLTDSGRMWAHAQAEIVTLFGQAGAWYSTERQAFAFHVTADLLRVTNPVIPAALMCRREVLMKAGGLDEVMGHYWDWDLALRLTALGESAEVSDCSVLYGVYPDRPSQSHNPEAMRSDLERLCVKHGLGRLPSHNFFTMLSDPELAEYRQTGALLWDGDNRIWNSGYSRLEETAWITLS